jgi:predicted transcriptional regulator
MGGPGVQTDAMAHSDVGHPDSDGVAFSMLLAIGITCHLCERSECAARAFPLLAGALRIDPNVRGVSYLASSGESSE